MKMNVIGYEHFPVLVIEHNHGTLTLADAKVTVSEGVYYRFGEARTVQDRMVVGTLIAGGWESRLFHCTSFREAPKGEVMTYPLGSARIWEGKGGHYVSVRYCG